MCLCSPAFSFWSWDNLWCTQSEAKSLWFAGVSEERWSQTHEEPHHRWDWSISASLILIVFNLRKSELHSREAGNVLYFLLCRTAWSPSAALCRICKCLRNQDTVRRDSRELKLWLSCPNLTDVTCPCSLCHWSSLAVRAPDVRVDSALSLTPGLPASVLFLCVRQADCSGDQSQARSLCSAAVTALKAALKVTLTLNHMLEMFYIQGILLMPGRSQLIGLMIHFLLYDCFVQLFFFLWTCFLVWSSEAHLAIQRVTFSI